MYEPESFSGISHSTSPALNSLKESNIISLFSPKLEKSIVVTAWRSSALTLHSEPTDQIPLSTIVIHLVHIYTAAHHH